MKMVGKCYSQTAKNREFQEKHWPCGCYKYFHGVYPRYTPLENIPQTEREIVKKVVFGEAPRYTLKMSSNLQKPLIYGDMRGMVSGDISQ